VNPTIKGALKSKTMWLSAFVTALGIIDAKYADIVKDYVSPQNQALALALIGVAVGVLRLITSQSLADKGTPQ
jgi:ABC-type bacteriocin/lantibiotic exporter with double-glycine peptidase domain